MITWHVEGADDGADLCSYTFMTDVLNWAADAAEAGGFACPTLLKQSPWEGGWSADQARALADELALLLAGEAPTNYRGVLESMQEVAAAAMAARRGVEIT